MTITSRTAEPLPRAQRLAIVGVMGLALLTAALAVPRLVGGALFALAPVVREDGALPRTVDIRRNVDLLTRADGWAGWPDVGLYRALSLEMGHDAGEAAVLSSVLRSSPLRPLQWLRRGELTLAAGNAEVALADWRMSVYSGRIFPSAMVARLQLGLSLKDRMAPDDLQLLNDQVRLSFILRPQGTEALISDPRNAAYADYCREIIRSLSDADIDQIIRIYSLH